MKKKSVLVTSFLSLGAAGAFAQATPAPAAPEPMVPLTANINLTTKYKFRGQDQGNTDWFSPALQGGFDWSSSGFYVGNWNSNVSFSNAALEMDFYAGYKGEITKEFGYDVGILQYYYPQKDKVVSFDTTEIYAALTWTFLTLKYSHTISSDYFGFGKLQQMAAADNGSSLGGKPWPEHRLHRAERQFPADGQADARRPRRLHELLEGPAQGDLRRRRGRHDRTSASRTTPTTRSA